VKEQGYLPQSTKPLPVRAHANWKQEARLRERIRAVGGQTVQDSRIEGACGLVEEEQKGCRRAATRHPVLVRRSRRVAAYAAPRLVVPPLLPSAAAA
jgi:hypothetical protein